MTSNSIPDLTTTDERYYGYEDGTAVASSSSSLLSLPKTLITLFWNTLLLLVSLVCAALAALGWAILLYLLLTRTLTPRQATRSENLQLDFDERAIVGVATFVHLPPDGKFPVNTRFISGGEKIDVWLELLVPGSNFEGGMVQTKAELLSGDGTVAAHTSLAVRLHGRPRTLRSLVSYPYRWMGILTDAYAIKVPLFKGYREQASIPFVQARIELKLPQTNWVPETLGASVGVHTKLGLLRGFLYLLRPHILVSLIMTGVAILMIAGGSICCLIFFALWLSSISSTRRKLVPLSRSSSSIRPERGASPSGAESTDSDEEDLSALLLDSDDEASGLRRRKISEPKVPDHDWREPLLDPGRSVSEVLSG